MRLQQQQNIMTSKMTHMLEPFKIEARNVLLYWVSNKIDPNWLGSII